MDDTSPANRKEAFDASLKRIRRGISWFHWFIGLSILQAVVQTVLLTFGIEMRFSIGLGMTFLLTPFAYELSGGVVPTLLLNAVPIAVLSAIAYFSRTSLVVYAVGLVYMVADLGIYARIRDWIGIGIHLLALVFLVRGFLALRDVHRGRGSSVLSPRALASAAIVVGDESVDRPLQRNGAKDR